MCQSRHMISAALSIDPLNQRLPATIIVPDVRMSISVENCPHQRLSLIPFVLPVRLRRHSPDWGHRTGVERVWNAWVWNGVSGAVAGAGSGQAILLKERESGVGRFSKIMEDFNFGRKLLPLMPILIL